MEGFALVGVRVETSVETADDCSGVVVVVAKFVELVDSVKGGSEVPGVDT